MSADHQPLTFIYIHWISQMITAILSKTASTALGDCDFCIAGTSQCGRGGIEGHHSTSGQTLQYFNHSKTGNNSSPHFLLGTLWVADYFSSQGSWFFFGSACHAHCLSHVNEPCYYNRLYFSLKNSFGKQGLRVMNMHPCSCLHSLCGRLEASLSPLLVFGFVSIKEMSHCKHSSYYPLETHETASLWRCDICSFWQELSCLSMTWEELFKLKVNLKWITLLFYLFSLLKNISFIFYIFVIIACG